MSGRTAHVKEDLFSYERDHEEIETRSNDSRPEFLHENYRGSDTVSMDSGERRERERSPSPSVRTIQRYRVELERPRQEEEHDESIRRERTSSPTHRCRRKRSSSSVKSCRTTTRFREADGVVWDISRTKDVTMHLELDATEDLEPDLDDFCRLARLGNFQQAKQFFRDNLEQHIDDPYIFVQYAQMLMEMGDYHSFKVKLISMIIRFLFV